MGKTNLEDSMSKTTDDLKAAFAGESQASRKYLSFAKKADEEGFPQIARLFRAASLRRDHPRPQPPQGAGGHPVHGGEPADRHRGRELRSDQHVPRLHQGCRGRRRQEGTALASNGRWMSRRCMRSCTARQLAALEAHEAQAETDYYVCPFCGYTHEGPLEGKCPVCGTPGEKFERVS